MSLSGRFRSVNVLAPRTMHYCGVISWAWLVASGIDVWIQVKRGAGNGYERGDENDATKRATGSIGGRERGRGRGRKRRGHRRPNTLAGETEGAGPYFLKVLPIDPYMFCRCKSYFFPLLRVTRRHWRLSMTWLMASTLIRTHEL